MRLKSVWISEYKNLKEFKVDFEPNSFLEVFVGKNGSGKSNFFEALLEIFRHLLEPENDKSTIYYDYILEYVINDTDIKIEYKSLEWIVNGEKKKRVSQDILPDDIIVYYSGHNETINDIVSTYEEIFRDKIKDASFDDSRKFIGIGSEYKSILLSFMLLLPEDNSAKQFIKEKLKINTIGKELKIVLQRPIYAMSSSKNDFNVTSGDTDDETRYWKAKGITIEFLDFLVQCISTLRKPSEKEDENSYRAEGYLAENDEYIHYLDIEKLISKFEGIHQELFRAFDNLKTLGMLKGMSVDIVLSSGEKIPTDMFSDGQFQTVYIYSIMELFKDKNCIMLLDEPDSFLHPEWQFEFLKQVNDIADNEIKRNHILLCTHSASSIATLENEYIKTFNFNNRASIVNGKINKDEAIKLLSGNRIVLNDKEVIMSITTYLKNCSQPVLFTEGISDEIILDIAWSKLYPNESKPFCIHGAFDRIFLRNLFSRDEIKAEFPNRNFFALFDFDDAYDDWNGLKKHADINVDPFTGLIKQLKHEKHYAMLLPVPDDEKLKKQVLNSDNIPWNKGADCFLTIELLFYKDELLGEWFQIRETSCGGNLVEFVGDKIKFAEEYAPTLTKADFEIFRPIFEFVKSKCSES